MLSFVMAQLADPEDFMREVRRLYAHPELSSVEELTFADGRVFERYSQPQLLDDVPVGRVWSFRDVTDYRELESELRRQAHTDALTGLANRYRFMDELRARGRGRRRPRPAPRRRRRLQDRQRRARARRG